MRRRRHGAGALEKNGRLWRMQYYVKGQRVKESTGTADRAAAEKLLKQRLAEIALDETRAEVSVEKATIADLCQMLLANYRLHKKKELKIASWRFDKHLAKTLGPVAARRATTRHFTDYIEQRREAGAADATINRELAIVRRGYTLAKQQDPPLVTKLPYIPKLKEENVRQGFLEPEEYERLLEELPLKLKALYVCGYTIGPRKGELRKLRWPQVDFSGGVIRLEGKQTKNGSPRELPIAGDMEKWLRFQEKTCPAGCEFVFHGAKKRPVSHRLDGWREACERAGLPGLIFHDMRRSAARNLRKAHVPEHTIMKIAGWKTRSMFQRYDINDSADVADAGKAIGDYLKERRQAARGDIRRVK